MNFTWSLSSSARPRRRPVRAGRVVPELGIAADLDGNALTLRIASINPAASGGAELSRLDLDGISVLGDVVNPYSPQMATTMDPGRITGSAVPVARLTAPLEPGATYLVSYSIISAMPVSTLWTGPEIGGAFATTTLPSFPGTHNLLLKVTHPDGTRICSLDGDITFGYISCRKAEWHYMLPEGTAYPELAETPHPGPISGEDQIVSALSAPLEPGAAYTLRYHVTAANGPVALSTDADTGSPFPTTPLPHEIGHHAVTLIAQSSATAAIARVTGDLSFARFSCRRAGGTTGRQIRSVIRTGNASAETVLYTPDPDGRALRSWQHTGPGNGGWVMHSAIASDGVSYLAAVDVGCAYITRDAGASWRQLGAANGITQTHGACVEFGYSDPDLVYLGNDRGLFRSADGGNNFDLVISGGRIAQVTAGATKSYAAQGRSHNTACRTVLASQDNGATWTVVNSSLPPDTHIMNIRIHPVDNDRALFISSPGRFFRDGARKLYETDDGGVTIKEVDVGGFPIYDAAWSNDGLTSYITTREEDNTGRLLSKAPGSESALTQIHTPASLNGRGRASGTGTGMIWVPAGTANTLRLYDRRRWWWPNVQTTDGGATWTFLPVLSSDVHFYGWSAPGWATNSRNVKEWSFSKHHPDIALYTTNQFIRATTNGGQVFRELGTVEAEELAIEGQPGFFRTTGIDNTNGMAVAQHPQNPDFVMIALADLGVFRTLDGGGAWQNCNQEPYTGNWRNYGGSIRGIAMDPDDENIVWVANSAGTSTEEVRLRILKSTSGGVQGSWVASGTGMPPGHSSTQRVYDLALDPTSPFGARRLFTTLGGDVWRSEDDGSTWQMVLSGDDSYRVAVSADGVVMAGGRETVYVSGNHGDPDTWTAVTIPGFSDEGNARVWAHGSFRGVADIKADPYRPGIFWIAATSRSNPTGGVFRYENGAVTRVTSESYVRTVAVSPANGFIYRGQSAALSSGGYREEVDGIAVSKDAGATWEVIDNPMAFNNVGMLYIPEQDPSTMWVINIGHGFWKTALP